MLGKEGRWKFFVHPCGVRMSLLVGDSSVFSGTLVPPTQTSLKAKEADRSSAWEEVEHSEGQLDDLKGVAEVGNWKVPFQSIGEILNVRMNTGELPIIILNCPGLMD